MIKSTRNEKLKKSKQNTNKFEKIIRNPKK